MKILIVMRESNEIIDLWKEIMDKMFGKVIYFDEEKINEYKSVLLGKNSIKVNQIDVSDDKGIGINIPIANGSIKANKSYKAEIQNSLLLVCNEFENVLNEKQVDYSDFTTRKK